jgi:hypothetical protein
MPKSRLRVSFEPLSLLRKFIDEAIIKKVWMAHVILSLVFWKSLVGFNCLCPVQAAGA